MKKIILMCSVLTLFIVGCAGGGAYLSYENMTYSTLKSKSHYLNSNDKFDIGIRIRNGGAMGNYWYEVLAYNKDSYPIYWNFERDGDALFFKLDGKMFIATYGISEALIGDTYPQEWNQNPEDILSLVFNVPKKYNERINDIEQLELRHNGETYILDKNPLAKWDDLSK